APGNCTGASVAYWATDMVPDAVNIAPVDDFLPAIILPVRINGQPLLAMLDSSAPTSVLDRPAAARVGVTPETPGVVATGSLTPTLANTPIKCWIGTFQSFAVGNDVIKDAQIQFGEVWAEARAAIARSRSPFPRATRFPEMVLGVDFLLAHRVL